MKQFFKVLFASLFGAILAIFLIIVTLIGIIYASSTEETTYADKNVLVFKDILAIGELTQNSTPEILSSYGNESQIGLADITRALEIAAKDDKICGIVLENAVPNAGYETTIELTKALLKFKESGKFIMSYNTVFEQKSYMLATAANEITVNGETNAEFHGISASSIHYKNLLEKVGIKPMVFRCGKFKSYVETYTEDKMSEENRFQKQEYITDIWNEYEKMILNNRHVTKEELNKFADSVLICMPTELLANGFIDAIQYEDEFWESVRTQMGLDKKDDISKISIENYITDKADVLADTTKSESIALVVAQGSIDLGKSDETAIGSDTYTALFRKIRKDSTIKAVVFRINSGGGSALASELIWREVSLTAAEKPVIVSMGDYAASGGYYIATPATKIVASPTTLTGSIGVFGMYATVGGLLDKVGITTDKVNTHAHSDFGDITREMSPTECAAIQKSVDKTYLTFKKRVAEGRKLSMQQVEEIAQGHVWSGIDALQIGLVDTIGTLSDAIQIAINQSGLEKNKVNIKTYPNARSWYDVVMDDLESKISVKEQLTNDNELLQLLRFAPTKNGIYAQLPYQISIQ